MELSFEFWYLLPLSIIATIAMSSGVVIGSQLGSILQKSVPEDKMKVSISLLSILIGGFMLYTLK